MDRNITGYLGRVLFWIALASQLFHVHVFFTYSGSDRNQQILAAVNWLEGRGMTRPVVFSENLSELKYEPVKGWPPGYPVVISGLYQWASGDKSSAEAWFFSALILEYLGVIIVFAGVYFLLWLLRDEISPAVFPLIFLFWTFSFTPFHFTTASEEIALGAYLLATGAWISGWKNAQPAWLWIVIACTGFLVAGWFRYAYIPLMIIGPGVTFLFYRKRNTANHIPLLVFVATVLLMIIWWMVLHPSHSREGNLETMVAEGNLYPQHWLRMSAFPVKSLFFMGLDPLISRLGIRQPGATFFVYLLYITSVVAIVLFPARMWWQHGKAFLTNGQPERPVSTLLSAWFLIVMAVICAMLMLLSLVNQPEVFEGKKWTYVEETRYYAPLLIAFPLFLLVRLFDHDTSRMGRTALRFFLLAALLFAMGHSAFKYYERFGRGNMRETRYDAENQLIVRLCQYIEHEKKDSGTRIVFAEGTTFYEQDEAAVVSWGGAGVISFESIRNTQIHATEPVEILIRTGASIARPDIHQLKGVSKPEEIISWEGISVYRVRCLTE
ncbi:MAG: hypothetical protein R3C61_04760 [Bacteroidia bacterium]